MAAKARVSTELLIPNKWHDRDATTNTSSSSINIEKNNRMISTDDRSSSKLITSETKLVVPVIYYLSRNGHLQHPHFMEVPLSSSRGLFLKDVINRLNFLRGKGMPTMYSWSSKRSYKNGYLWHDLSEDDLIHPTNGHEYVLKGSELHQNSLSFISDTTASSTQTPPETNDSSQASNFPRTARRKNQSWSSFDNPQEYRVYKSESSRDLAGKFTDAATQTVEQRKRGLESAEHDNYRVELSRGELSPPPSNSSSEGLDGVSGSRDIDRSADTRDRTVSDEHPSGRMKASLVLKQLISCGSFDRRSTSSKDDQGSLEGVEYGKRVQRDLLDR
ncbi:hypothetical protein LguiA_034998 [Lonicera macranthoides]